MLCRTVFFVVPWKEILFIFTRVGGSVRIRVHICYVNMTVYYGHVFYRSEIIIHVVAWRVGTRAGCTVNGPVFSSLHFELRLVASCNGKVDKSLYSANRSTENFPSDCSESEDSRFHRAIDTHIGMQVSVENNGSEKHTAPPTQRNATEHPLSPRRRGMRYHFLLPRIVDSRACYTRITYCKNTKTM